MDGNIVMKKKVCILRSNGINPDSRVEKEAAAICSAGYEVTVIGWDRSSSYSEKRAQEMFYGEKIQVVRFGHKASFGEGFKNIKSYLKFQKDLFKWLISHRKEIDIIHACDFDTALFSMMANIWVKAKYIFDIFDFLYGEPKGVFQKIIRRTQIAIINHSDATIICTEQRKKQIADANPKHIVVIHNTPPKVEIDEEEYCNGEKTKIVYVGILQDFRLLKEMSQLFIERKDLELHIGGFGKYEDFFSDLAKNNENVFFYGRLNYSDTLELERKSDIMLAIYDPSIENHRFAAPNKFYESLMLGKPVIMVKNTGMSEIVEKYGIGQLIEYNYSSFRDGVDKLVRIRYQWKEMGVKMRLLYDEFYSWDVMSKRLAELYNMISEEQI